MPRKAVNDAPAEPRRSARIKDQPKTEPTAAPPKKPVKPRGKKAKEAAAAEEPIVIHVQPESKAAEEGPRFSAEEAIEPEKGEQTAEKPKSSRGKKRTAVEKDAAENNAVDEGATAPSKAAVAPTANGEAVPPASKKVSLSYCWLLL